jgi:hypothetical protein
VSTDRLFEGCLRLFAHAFRALRLADFLAGVLLRTRAFR